MSIGSVKLFLLTREYLSSPVNVLTNGRKILHITNRDFFHLNCLWNRLPCSLSKGLLKQGFLDTSPTRSFAVPNFGNTKAMRVIFFWNCSKFNLDFRSAEKKWLKIFSFFDKCMWIDCVKLSLLRREYLSCSVNVLTYSFKILYRTRRGFSQINIRRSDQ